MLHAEKISRLIIADEEVILKTGKLAKQSNGAVVLQCRDTILLATAVMSKEPKEGVDFFPLTVEFSEKMYSAGKIPGGFFKREARPSVNATLTARLIDRPIRPSFPKNFYNEVQVIVTVLSYDETLPLDHLSIIAASAALSVSDIPFEGPIGAALIGSINGRLIASPTRTELEESDLEIVVAGTKDAVLMIEAGAKELDEEAILEAIRLAQTSIRESIALQEDLVRQAGKEKKPVPAPVENLSLEEDIRKFLGDKIETDLRKGKKKATEDFLSSLENDVVQNFGSADDEKLTKQVKSIFSKIKKEKIRYTIIKEKLRPDGRKLDEIRPIESEIGLLPSAHGSALFTRGETQSLAVTTLGTAEDEQIEDNLLDSGRKNYYFHYNFPPFSVGEVGFLGRTGRRELGHGALAERALKTVLPLNGEFPYTIRIVSEILESNGSSSMASVCSGTLSLMDAGVPISAPVSGIAMGLLLDNEDYTILSDIQGLEDHYGDMDFKVAGTRKGITALQLDIKVSGLSDAILRAALYQAKEGREVIMKKMLEVISSPRAKVAENAPRIEYISINPEKVGLVIGPGGKMIRQIEEQTKASVIITDGSTGQVCISAKNTADLEKAKNLIIKLAKDVEVGDVYAGKVVKTTNFGAFVELFPGKEGLVHISAISKKRINRVEDVLNVGDPITVQVKEIDRQNRINLVPVAQTAEE